jgi:hypothetical protein
VDGENSIRKASISVWIEQSQKWQSIWIRGHMQIRQVHKAECSFMGRYLQEVIYIPDAALSPCAALPD